MDRLQHFSVCVCFIQACMHASASMCFPRVSQSSCVILCSCISGPHVLTRFEKTKILHRFGVKPDIMVGFWLEPRK